MIFVADPERWQALYTPDEIENSDGTLVWNPTTDEELLAMEQEWLEGGYVPS